MANKTYLLLGEGDFTFSLDMCRYLASFVQKDNEGAIGGETGETTSSPDITSSSSTNPRHKSFSITCTGVDTLSELHDKYKDIEFILRNIRSCCSSSVTMKNKQQQVMEYVDTMMSMRHHNTNTSDRICCVTTSIMHGINAVDAEGNSSNDSDAIICEESFDHVIFNHPHLGTEDAQLHSRFLQHFFYAATKRWMKPQTGILHLTLVNGQCARWKCIEGARKHGLVLLRRGVFVAPPTPPPRKDKTDTTYYKLRRHQSGRSFANRRRMQQQQQQQNVNGKSSSNIGDGQNDSEILVFGRECDYPTGTIDASVGLLPWETDEFTITRVADNKIDANANLLSTTTCDKQQINDINTTTCQHPCKHCSKCFKEQRSLKNHMFSSHPDCDEVRMWNLEKMSKKKSKKRKLKDDHGVSSNDSGKEGREQPTLSINIKTFNNKGDAELQGPPWICNMCKQTEVSTRVFPHKQALLDHQRAKHFGVHVDIKPDWQREKTAEKFSSNNDDAVNQEGSNNAKESCPICDHRPYTTEMDQLRHRLEFVPSSSAIANTIAQRTKRSDIQFNNLSNPVYKCSHCSKSFRELRAQLQHENFCSVANNIDIYE